METIEIKNPVTTAFKYGSYTPNHFYKVDGQFVRRVDIYESFASGMQTPDPIMCVNQFDLTPVYNGVYNSECYGCYAGYGHTELRHHNSIKP